MALNVTAHRGESVSRRSGTLAERYNRGVSLRRKIPRKKHADLLGPADRDPVAILAAGDRTRVPELIPVRYERMLTSPFAFPLARAHARSADPAVLAGYMGKSDAFDDALASFAMAYAVRTQKDYDQLAKSKRNAAKKR
jgi:hypothetical protein